MKISPHTLVVLNRLREDELTEMLRVEDPSAPQGRAIIKRRRSGVPRLEQAIRLQNEYEMVSRFRLPSMLTLLNAYGAGPEIVLRFQDVEGEPLNRQNFVELDRQLLLADALIAALGAIHQAGLIHRDIRPINFLASLDQVYLLDFSKALAREREHVDLDILEWNIESLRYVAPEQTGRMNRPVDCRADYYSFGAVLYFLLTGQPPFTTDSLPELLYQHLAVAPVPPDLVNPRVPPFLAGLVMKLLAKDPDRRYQSVEGIRADLRVARDMIAGTTQEIGVAGAGDILPRLFVSHRLYGREQERETLLDSFERACRGGREMLLIGGYSGVGKTSLIRETYIPVTRQRTFFVAGKFDQLQRRLPYGAWIEALRKLIDFVLAEPEHSLQEWRQRLEDTLGNHGGVLTPVIPGLATLLGPQPPPPELPPVEALNRFNTTFCAFIRAFCLPERPLVIFLDDLQWIDSASLQLLDLLARDRDSRYLFLIGAYRDNEVSPSHPLMLKLESLRHEAAFRLSEIELQPLTLTHVAELVADTLTVNAQEARPLAVEVARKTGGNPFFLWQFLRTLRENNWIYFDLMARCWRWLLEPIRQANFADNVVDLMLHRFQQLPEITRKLLSSAACLGNRFDLDRLALLFSETLAKLYDTLLLALKEEFILPLTPPQLAEERLVIHHFRFMHDRMQEAAYRAIPVDEVAAIHHRIGRLLLAHTPEADLGERILEIVDHLNAARELIENVADRLELARLNLLAAQKARQSAAFGAALSYLQCGMEKLPDDLWDREHDLAYSLFRERGELEYLNGHSDLAEYFVEQAIARETDILRRADLYHMLVVQYTLRALYPKAIETARQGLALFSMTLPEQDYAAVRDAELAEVWRLLDGRSLDCLAELPTMVDPEQRTIMMLLTSLGPPCYRSHPQLWGVIVAREIRLCLQYGDVPSASYSYPAFGGLLTHVGQGAGKECAALYEVTSKLMAKFATPADISVGYLIIGSSLRHWFAPLAAATRDYLDAYQTGLDSGNLQYAVYAFGHNTYCRYFQGVPLDQLIGETQGYLEFCRQRNNLWGVDLLEGALRIFLSLRGSPETETSPLLDDPETVYLDRCEQHGNLQVLCIYYILKADAEMHLGQTRAAGASLIEAQRRLDSVSTQGLLPVTQFYLLKALLLADAPDLFNLTDAEARIEISAIRQRYAVWVESGAVNLEHALWLIRAEEARLDHALASALEAYDLALDSARNLGFWQRVAFVATLAATFWEGCGKPHFAENYRIQAYSAYRHWQANGITVKLADSARRGLQLRDLDIGMVIRTAQALARHTALNQLVPEVIRNVVNLSGAQRVVLILAHEENLAVAMESSPQGETYHDLPIPLDTAEHLPKAVIRYVARSQRPLIFSRVEIDESPLLNGDPYLRNFATESAWCMPLIYLGQLSGLLYIEHYQAANAFQSENGHLLEFLAAQAAISIRNTDLFSELENEVSARRRAEDALRLAYADLTRFAEISAHHLQEPTRRLLAYTQRLRSQLDHSLQDEETRLSLTFIEQGASRMRDLVRDIERYLSAAEPLGAITLQDTNTVLATVRKRILNRLNQVGGRIEASPLPPIRLDQPRLAIILEVLIENALVHRAPGQPPLIRVNGERSDAVTRLRIEDNGPGIAEEYRQRFFEVFERLRANPEAGTGIGLAIARRIVESRCGKIGIESSNLGGAAVVFELPDGN